MNLQELIKKYNKAIETDKILEGQYTVLQNQLNKALADLGMTYEEVLEKEEKLNAYIQQSIPKIEAYIEAVEEKKAQIEESFV